MKKYFCVSIILCFLIICGYYFHLSQDKSASTFLAANNAVFHTDLQKQAEVTVPVLMFHHLSDTVENPWTLTPDTFERDLRLLQEQQYEPISMKQLVDFVYQGKALPDKPVCITFDDGYESNYTIAYPLLKKYHMKATIFAIGSYVGHTTYKNTNQPINPHFSYAQAVEMMHSGLIDVQSHTYDMHQSAQFEQQRPVRESILPLKTESNLQYRQDLYADSQVYQKEYRKHTGKTLYVLAYPKGAYTPYTEQIFHKLGYAITFTTNSKKVNRVVQKDPTSLYALGRLSVSEAVTKAELLQYLEQK